MDAKAQELAGALAADYDDGDVARAVAYLKELQGRRDYESLMALAEAVSRVAPDAPESRRRYAQALIETGRASVAIDVLQRLRERLPADHAESVEAAGLIGRTWKQIYFDARVRGSDAAQRALQESIAAYRAAYEPDKSRTWHGVNVLALIEHCRVLGAAYPRELKARDLALELLQTLEKSPEEKRDPWWHATRAEASMALRDWGLIESSILNYTLTPGVEAFHLESTRRQFTQVWRIHEDPRDPARGQAVIEVLTAALMKKPTAVVTLPANQINVPQAGAAHFEALLGPNKGMQSKRWWETGLTRANSVAAIRKKSGDRFGTGFLVSASDFGLEARAPTLVLTNYHVVNDQGLANSLQPGDAEVVFESQNDPTPYFVARILWSSPPNECDASLLLLDRAVQNALPLAIARALPVLEPAAPQAQVCIIGHPGGRELTFSFQNNEIIDHEGPTAGKPAKPDLRLVHYMTSTEGGSSGSPVFNTSWDVIALHHKGGTIGMPRLNGKMGTYGANEGVWLQSIITQVKAAIASGGIP